MKKKGSKPANNETVNTNTNETPGTQVSPSSQSINKTSTHPTLGGDNHIGSDTQSGSTSKKKKKKKNKTKTTLSVFESAQQHMGAAVAAAAVADFHQHGADWFSSSSSSQSSTLPPPPPPPPLPPTPRQLSSASLPQQQQQQHHHHLHHHHSHTHSRSFSLQQPTLSSSASTMTNSNSKQRHQQRSKNNNTSSTKSQDTDEFWSSMSNTEERQKIREFWLQLGEDERRSLVKVEKEAVLRKMKEQQKHSCNCSVCGKKRTAIEDELEVLYDAYYEELEQYANHQQHTQFYGRHPLHAYSATDVLQESYCEDYLDDVDNNLEDEYDQDLDDDDEDNDTDHIIVNGRMLGDDDEGDEDEDDDDDLMDEEGEDTFDINYEVDHGSGISGDEFSDSYDEEIHNFAANGLTRHSHGGGDHFSFGNSLTVKGGILTVADDLLKNDGKKFLDMMERLAERRMQRDDEADMDQDEEYYDEDEDDDDIYDDDNEEDTRTEEQRMEEGRRMFQIFAARMFEQRVLAAYREKVAKERQQRLIQELEEEDRQRQERELKKQRDKERKKDKKRQLKQKQEEERLAKEAQRQADEAKKRAEQQLKLEMERQKREQERRLKEEEKRLKEEERRLKEEEKRRRLKEEKERAAEKERQRKEKEDYDRRQKEFLKEKDRREKELKDELARRDRELKEQLERHQRQVKERATKTSDVTSKSTAAVTPPSDALESLSISKSAKSSTNPNSPAPISPPSHQSTPSSLPLASATIKSAQTHSETSKKQSLSDAMPTSSNPIEQHSQDVFTSPTTVQTNNIFAPPSQHLFGNSFPHLDILQSSHPLLGQPINNHSSPHAPPLPQQLSAPVCILPPAPAPISIVNGGTLMGNGSFHHPVESVLSTQDLPSLGGINQFQLSNSSSSVTSNTVPPSANLIHPVNNNGVSIPSHHGRRSSAMAGPIGSPLTHRFSGIGMDHISNQETNSGSLSNRTGNDTLGGGPDHTFFSNFLFGEPANRAGISPNASTTTASNDTDVPGHLQTKQDMPMDRRFSTETSAFGWKNGWSATSMLSENLHGKLFGDTLTDRHKMLLDRARVAYQKLDEITQTNFFLGGTTPYHTMAQLHRMMNDLYCDTTVDARELYDVLVQSPQSGFQCIQHSRHGMVVRYDGTLSTAATNSVTSPVLISSATTTSTSTSSSTTSTQAPPSLVSLSNVDDPLPLRRPSTLLHNPLASSSTSFPSRPLPNNHHTTHPIPLASTSHHLLHPQQYHLPPNTHLSPPLLSPSSFNYAPSLHSSQSGQTKKKESS